ncbi:hypothetical protein Sm713_76250 [Streptomyces sp. TS71-3]|nr:hypothetical protein Sm713_76250 [Streptomyces sp. TS71-3]
MRLSWRFWGSKIPSVKSGRNVASPQTPHGPPLSRIPSLRLMIPQPPGARAPSELFPARPRSGPGGAGTARACGGGTRAGGAPHPYP